MGKTCKWDIVHGSWIIVVISFIVCPVRDKILIDKILVAKNNGFFHGRGRNLVRRIAELFNNPCFVTKYIMTINPEKPNFTINFKSFS
jgi:hypothetical protein